MPSRARSRRLGVRSSASMLREVSTAKQDVDAPAFHLTPFVAFLRAGDGHECQQHRQQPHPALEVAQPRRKSFGQPLPETRMDQLRKIRLAAAVEADEQADDARTNDHAGADPERLGEMQRGVIHGSLDEDVQGSRRKRVWLRTSSNSSRPSPGTRNQRIEFVILLVFLELAGGLFELVDGLVDLLQRVGIRRAERLAAGGGGDLLAAFPHRSPPSSSADGCGRKHP